MVLILKRLRRRGKCLKSHSTDCEKLGIELATPGLQDIGLSPTAQRNTQNTSQVLGSPYNIQCRAIIGPPAKLLLNAWHFAGGFVNWVKVCRFAYDSLKLQVFDISQTNYIYFICNVFSGQAPSIK